MDNMKHRRLQELDRSDFDIVKGEPDIRGWDVRNTSGRKIGEVEELIIDAQQKKVRYMVVDLDDNELKLDHRKVLIPIGLAELHKEDDDVLLPAVEVEQLSALPAYDKNSLDEETERKICNTLGRKTTTVHKKTETREQPSNTRTTTEHDTEFYKHEYFDDDNLYKNRLHEAKPAHTKKESDYERGFRLWESRSEGGVIGDTNKPDGRERELGEEARMEKIRNRRKLYENQRRRTGDNLDDNGQRRKKDNSITGRLRDEGLQDA